MAPRFDAILVGSGPAAVSAAWPLLESGLQILMVHGGRQVETPYPARDFLLARARDEGQWRWIVGADFHALRMRGAASPKMRAPTHSAVFADYAEANRITAENFNVVGSLAAGGLSNAWGCGVARLSAPELSDFPCPATDMDQAYRTVSQRMGISGHSADDLAEYFGLDDWAQPAIAMDALHATLFARYQHHRDAVRRLGLHMGRTRVAALSADLRGRRACDLSGNCLWGCSRGALYSAADDLLRLRQFPNFHEAHGVVQSLRRDRTGWIVDTDSATPAYSSTAYSAPRIILAAGTLASTRIALRAMNHRRAVRVLSCPTAAFLLWLPAMLGTPRTAAFGLGQLSFALDAGQGASGFGSTIGLAGVPLSEFAPHVPMLRPGGIDLLRALLSSCVAGNLFLPGHWSASTAQLTADDGLHIAGAYRTGVDAAMAAAATIIRRAYRRLGALMLPGSFLVGAPGTDVHYAGTLPMRAQPAPAEADPNGEICGLPGVHVVDGSCLPSLPEKSHTLTMMANAHRIGREIVSLSGGGNPARC